MTSQVIKIRASKQPRRPHYIQARAERLGLRAIDLAKEIGATRGQVSRWYDGASPGEEWQEKLAAFFHCSPEALFTDPDEDWLKRFFEGRKREEIERIKQTLEAAFPRAAVGGGGKRMIS